MEQAERLWEDRSRKRCLGFKHKKAGPEQTYCTSPRENRRHPASIKQRKYR